MTAARLAAARAAAALAPIIPKANTSRLLYIDGDALAYTCAGRDDTPAGVARARLFEYVQDSARAAGCAYPSNVRVLITARDSHKGYRYAVANVKPYQGQRSSSRRPRNWAHLRETLESGAFEKASGIKVEAGVAEADDLFGMYASADPENTVIQTQDKDMRMLPGWHLTWDDRQITYVAPGVYDHKFNDKQYGTKWFWLQMLHGDSADNIPGLPKYQSGHDNQGQPKFALCGEVTAGKILSGATTDAQAFDIVARKYWEFYGVPDFCFQFLEQAILLWMRRGYNAPVFDVIEWLRGVDQERCYYIETWGKRVIQQRIAEAVVA